MTDAYVPVPTGVAVSVETLRRSLEKLGHIVYVFAPRYSDWKDQDPYVARVPGFFGRRRFHPIIWPRGSINPKSIAKLKLDIVHSHFFFDYFKLAPEIARIARVPHLTTLYRAFPEVARQKKSFLRSRDSNVSKAIKKTRKYLGECDHIIALSRASKSYFSELSIATPISVLPIGLFPKDFISLPPEAIRERFDIPADRKIILFVGRMEEENNILFLFKAFRRVWKAVDDVHLLIVGGGTQLKRYRTIAHTQPFGKFVSFTGFLPKALVNKIYGAVDLYVNPSTIDPQPLGIIEAQVSGTPAVTVKGLGGQDFIENHSNGLVSEFQIEDFSDKIIELLRKDNVRLEFSLRARAAARQFRALQKAHELITIYDESKVNYKNKFK